MSGVTEITKSQIIRASGCLPIFSGRPILSSETSQKSAQEISAYRSKDPAPWGYSDLPNLLRELFRFKSLDKSVAALHAKFDDVQAEAKSSILKFVASKLSLSQFSCLDDRLPAKPLDQNYAFRPPFDLALKSEQSIHFVFVSPSAEPVLKASQRELLIRSLSQPQNGYQENLLVDFFEFPKVSFGRDRQHVQMEFEYFDVADVIKHFLNFAMEDNRQNSGDLFC